MIVKLTKEQIDDQRRDGTRLGPGVWVDRDGAMHFSVPELLKLFDVVDTPANREAMVRVVREQLDKLSPESTIVEQEE